MTPNPLRSNFDYRRNNPELSGILMYGVRVIRREEKFVIGLNINSLSVDIQDPWLMDQNGENNWFNLVYFPTNENHRKILAESKTKQLGPNTMYSGSAAVLRGEYYAPTRTVSLDYLQFSFIQGSPPELTRSLASKYQGASYRLLETLLINKFREHFDIVRFDEDFARRHSSLISRMNEASKEVKFSREAA